MTRRRKMPWLSLSSCALVLALASCGGPEAPPPEGHHLLLRFTSLDPNLIERVRVSFSPQGMDEDFMMIEPMSYADGAIDVTVEPDGALVMILDGPHVAALAQQDGTSSTYVYDLEVYSDDEVARTTPPFVTVAVDRSREVIANGSRFLPAWPLPLGQSTEIMVPCTNVSLCF